MRKTISVALLLVFAILIRIVLIPYNNYDLATYVIPWLDEIIKSGGLAALREPFYNYSPPYLYLLWAGSFFVPLVGKLAVIKMISIVIDFLLGWIIYLIVKTVRSEKTALVAFFAVLFSPVVIVDSAYWGQCDNIYTFFILVSLFFFLKNRPAWGMAAFASGFAFKAQAAFLGPVILILLLNKTIPWKTTFLFPIVYAAWMIPALVVGVPMERIVLTYLVQSGTYEQLSMNAPNLYKFLSNTYYATLLPIGLAVTAIISVLLVIFIWKSRKPFDQYRLLLISLLFLFLYPMILPKMHDRYFYSATVLSICLPFLDRRFFVLPFILQATSMLAYTIFLRGVEIIPIQVASVMNSVVLGWLIYAVFKMDTKPNSSGNYLT